MKTELQIVSFEEKPVLKGMLELYLSEIVEFESRETDKCGEFEYGYLDQYWTEPERYAFFVSFDDKTVGFVLLNRFGYSDRVDCSVAEFFIMRKYRNNGFGIAAALAAFERFRGFWEIRTHEGNEAAKNFWRRTIERYTDGNFTEFPEGLEGWKGPIWTFEN